MTLRCDVGGKEWYPLIPGPAVYTEPCPDPPTHRYRSKRHVAEAWGYRCARHAGWLDRSICTVEPLPSEWRQFLDAVKAGAFDDVIAEEQP